MSGFYEVTAASGCGGGRRVHEKAPVRAGCSVSHPAADRTLTAASDAAAPFFSTRPTGSLGRDGPTALTGPAGTNEATQLLQHSPNILLIPGTSSVAHLRNNVAGASLTLPESALAALDAIGS